MEQPQTNETSPTETSPTESSPTAGVGRWLLLAFVGLLVAHRVPLLLGRGFDVDELQHLHGAFSIHRGLTPHVDYFEHHSSWFAWMLSGLIEAGGASWTTIMLARGLMALFAVAGLLCTHALARRLGGGWLPAAAVILHATTLLFVEKSLEVRPDVPASALWTLAAVLAVDGLRSGHRRAFAGAGMALGVGLLFTFKLAFGAIGLGLAVLLTQARAGGWRGVRAGLPDLLTLVGWSAFPVALLFLSLAQQGQLDAFMQDVVLGPLEWTRELDPREYLAAFLLGNPLLLGFGAVGMLELLRAIAAGGERVPAASLIVLASGTILFGWFTIPVPWPQFLMPLWPLLACAAAVPLVGLAEPSGRAALARCGGALAVVAGAAMLLPISRSELLEPLAAAAAAAALGLAAGRARGPLSLLVVAAGAGAAVAVMIQLHPGTDLGTGLVGAGALCLLAAAAAAEPGQGRAAAGMAALAFFPLIEVARMAEERPVDGFRAQFDFVDGTLGPDDAVLTGWTGCAVFQPHAYRYFFLHRGMLRMLDDEAKGADVLRVLEADPPAAVIRDAGTRGLGEGVQAFIDARYEPSGVGDVWLAR